MISRRAQRLIRTMITIVCAVIIGGCTASERDTARTQAEPVSFTLTADQLFAEYDRNEIAADQKYKGAIVVVTGAVQDIGKDLLDQAYILIGGTGMLDGVQCTFTSEQQASLARLSKGQRVTVKGEVGGKFGNVLLDKCALQ